MKYLIVIMVVLFGVWLWRRNREDPEPALKSKDSRTTSSSTSAEAQLVVSCARCGVHVPQGEASKGAFGSYCSPAHRQAQEG